MSHYSPSEIKEILIHLSKQPETDTKFIRFERLGILVPQEVNSSETEDKDEGFHFCSVCKKKLVSAHLLDLHVTENHDSYFDLQKEMKPMVRNPEEKQNFSSIPYFYLVFMLFGRV